jgi:hypothetical protein
VDKKLEIVATPHVIFTHPQNSSTLSKDITFFISSIHPCAATEVDGVAGIAELGVGGMPDNLPLVVGESNHNVHEE